MPWRVSRASDSSQRQLHVSRACSRSDSRITEEAQRRLTRFRLAHSGAMVLCDLLFEMEAQLRIELFAGSLAAE